MHLGHPIIFNHKDRNKAYEFIINKFRTKLTTVKATSSTMLVVSLTLSLFLRLFLFITCPLSFFSKAFVENINSIIRMFWWTGVQDDNPTNPIAFRSWEDICQTKQNGGLGIRDLYTVNKSLITQAAGNIANNKNSFLTTILKAKYFHNTAFWTANTNGPRSVFWSSML